MYYYKYRRTGSGGPYPGGNFQEDAYLGSPCPVGKYEYEAQLAPMFRRSGRVLQGKPSTNVLPEIGWYPDFYEGVPPETEELTLLDVSITTKRKAKEFEALRAKGRIVLSPMRKALVTARINPGVPFGASRLSPVSFSHRRPYGPADGGSRCGMSRDRVSLPYLYGIPVSPPRCLFQHSYESPKGVDMVNHWYDRYNTTFLVKPPSELVPILHKTIVEALSFSTDSGLVTSAVAEANNGVWDILTEVGELKETVGFVLGSLRSIVDLVVKLRRNLLKARKRPGAAAAEIADEVASLWMQFRYAVSPIGYSIDDALDHMSRLYGEYSSVRQGTEKTFSFDLPDGWVCEDLKVIHRCFVKSRFTLDTELHGLKMNPFSTAWELTMLSFVVDWVLNIGDLLSSLSAPSNLLDRGTMYSIQAKPQQLQVVHESGFFGSITLDIASYEARPIDPFVHVGLNVDLEMSWKRWLDAISLSWGFTRSALTSR